MIQKPAAGQPRSSLVTLVYLVVASAVAPALAEAQQPEIQVEDPVFAFLAELVGHRCEIRTEWPNGRPFRLDKDFAWGLDGRIVTVHTAIVDELGNRTPRSHGVRAHDTGAEAVRFWEFDRLGNITEGPVWVEDGTLYYQYFYEAANQTLRDSWTPLGDGSYAYRIRVWDDGEWGATYMDDIYRCRKLRVGQG